MKKLAMILALSVSLSSAGDWITDQKIKELWISPGHSPIVTIVTYQAYNQVYAFPLYSHGNAEMFKLAQEAIAQNLNIKLYAKCTTSCLETFYTGLAEPYVTSVKAKPLYSISIHR